MTRAAQLVLIFTVIACLAPAPASAQGFVSPFIGTTFNAPNVGSVKNGSQAGFGVDFGGFGKVIGGETDIAYYPKVLDNDVVGLEKSRVFTLSGNVLVNIPIPRVRPYATGGVGYLRLNVRNLAGVLPATDFNQNKFAWNVGGGVFGFFTENLGIRGDVRYFRAASFDTNAFENGTGLFINQFDFWRAAIGFAAKF